MIGAGSLGIGISPIPPGPGPERPDPRRQPRGVGRNEELQNDLREMRRQGLLDQH